MEISKVDALLRRVCLFIVEKSPSMLFKSEKKYKKIQRNIHILYHVLMVIFSWIPHLGTRMLLNFVVIF